MTKDELRKHCEKMCIRYSCIPDSSAYEEHKLVLKLLDQEESVLKALEDVRAEIEADIEFNKDKKGLVNLLGQGKMMAVQIIDRKIKEIEHDNS